LDAGSASRKAATYIGQHEHGINKNRHSLSGIRTHDPSVRVGDDISCLRLRGNCDMRLGISVDIIQYRVRILDINMRLAMDISYSLSVVCYDCLSDIIIFVGILVDISNFTR
jgi:hypothetical protein